MADYIVHKAVEYGDLGKFTRERLQDPHLWVAMPKFDGCQSILLFANGKFHTALSRTGEVTPSMFPTGQAIADQCKLPDGLVAVLGEAWNGVDEFNVISGKFRKRKPSDLKIVPFDVVCWDGASVPNSTGAVDLYESKRTYLSRHMESVRALGECTHVITSPIWLFNGDLQSAMAEFTPLSIEYKSKGLYDGVMLARANGAYFTSSGKTGEFIKLKPLLSVTVTVTGAALDFGTKTGKNTAALKFMLDGVEQKVSTGLTQAQVEEITALGWNGYRIEVEAMGKTVNGLLREPRFKGIRTDA